MGVFPQMGIIDDLVLKTINNRAGKNIKVSNLVSWIRISSAVEDKINGTGLILESIPDDQNFAMAYGTTGKSGAVGTNFEGIPVYAENDRINRPSPVIEGLQLENGSKGLSRKAKFSIKCFTLAQAEIVTKYFFEPGYVVLVEYGWNLKKSWERKADLKNGGACEIAKFNSYQHITKKRNESEGTYDGFMGQITDGGYQSSDDEAYIIDVELTTLGEIPTYLQIHKSGNSDISSKNKDKDKTDLIYEVSEIDANADNTSSVGLALFQQMYNKLPAEKRTQVVKNMTGASDSNGLPWTDERNFINIDEEIRERFMSELEGESIYLEKGKKVKVPDGIQLISDDSFIRVELAFAILNTYHANVKHKFHKCDGRNVVTYDYTINIDDTKIGAHKWMFSTDTTKLYVPNTNLPEFGLKWALTTESEIEVFFKYEEIEKEGNTIDGNPFKDSTTDRQVFSFPAVKSFKSREMTGTFIQTADTHEWGYLKNLYINFDFFIEVLNRTNYVAKDIYYEILNGLSSAVGSYWQFELVETPSNPDPRNIVGSFDVLTDEESKNRQGIGLLQNNSDANFNNGSGTTWPMQIAVCDINFIGGAQADTSKIPSFQSRGLESPFLTSNLNMPIPANMRNQVLGKRSSAKINTGSEGRTEDYDKFFNPELDPVMKILDSFKESVTPGTEAKNSKSEVVEKKKTPEKIRKSNFDLFLKKAVIIPMVRDRKQVKDIVVSFFGSFDDKTYLSDTILVAGWRDTSSLKYLELRYNNIIESKTKIPANASILSIEFTFEMHGVSGLKVGDLFTIKDIPSKYKSGIFQIMEQSHALSDGQWKTSVSAKLRNFTI